jgi:hypothetical protein
MVFMYVGPRPCKLSRFHLQETHTFEFEMPGFSDSQLLNMGLSLWKIAKQPSQTNQKIRHELVGLLSQAKCEEEMKQIAGVVSTDFDKYMKVVIDVCKEGGEKIKPELLETLKREAEARTHAAKSQDYEKSETPKNIRIAAPVPEKAGAAHGKSFGCSKWLIASMIVLIFTVSVTMAYTENFNTLQLPPWIARACQAGITTIGPAFQGLIAYASNHTRIFYAQTIHTLRVPDVTVDAAKAGATVAQSKLPEQNNKGLEANAVNQSALLQSYKDNATNQSAMLQSCKDNAVNQSALLQSYKDNAINQSAMLQSCKDNAVNQSALLQTKIDDLKKCEANAANLSALLQVSMENATSLSDQLKAKSKELDETQTKVDALLKQLEQAQTEPPDLNGKSALTVSKLPVQETAVEINANNVLVDAPVELTETNHTSGAMNVQEAPVQVNIPTSMHTNTEPAQTHDDFCKKVKGATDKCTWHRCPCTGAPPAACKAYLPGKCLEKIIKEGAEKFCKSDEPSRALSSCNDRVSCENNQDTNFFPGECRDDMVQPYKQAGSIGRD